MPKYTNDCTNASAPPTAHLNASDAMSDDAGAAGLGGTATAIGAQS
jgi:hypothetical protein